MKRPMKLLILGLAVLLAFSGCSQQQELPSSEPESSAVVSEPPVSEPESSEPQPQVYNPLTGEPGFPEEAVGRRPVAVMVNNAGAALPQLGIGRADLIYEVVTEGGITRLMAVYADPDHIPYVGPVRSCRHYYLDLCEPFDAIYVHFGGSPAGYDEIQSLDVDDVDGMYDTGAFYQDQQRAQNKGREHSFFINTEGIFSVAKRKSISDEGETQPLFAFAEEAITQETKDAVSVYVPFSGSASAGFLYDDATGLYQKQRNGADHIDGNTGEILTFRNVLILYTNIYSYNGEALRRDMQFQNGSGYYITDGGKTAVNWSKGEEDTQFSFTLPDGSPLLANTGKTYVCIVDDDVTVTFSAE